MALPSSPANPPPPSSAATTTAPATTTTPRLFTTAPPPSRPPTSPYPQPQPQPHYHHYRQSTTATYPLPSQQHFSNFAPRGGGVPGPNRGVLYPVASSGRGFLPKPIQPQSAANQAVAIAANNHGGGFPPRPVVGAQYSQTVRAFGFPHSDPHGQAAHLIRPPHMQHSFLGSMPGMVRGGGGPVSTHQKVAPSQPLVSDSNGYKDQRDRSRDDTFTTVRDRKVRICEGSSLYALCRSWLRNGFPEETQPQYVDGVKPLPKPLPMPVSDGPVKKPGDKEEEEEEEEKSVETLSPKDLLQRHIKRAKRVRARLREERLHRIARYKTRLALLLPPLAEQQPFRNDTAASN